MRHFCSCSLNKNVRVYTRKHASLIHGFVRTLRHMGERRGQIGGSKYNNLPKIWWKSEGVTKEQNLTIKVNTQKVILRTKMFTFFCRIKRAWKEILLTCKAFFQRNFKFKGSKSLRQAKHFFLLILTEIILNKYD